MCCVIFAGQVSAFWRRIREYVPCILHTFKLNSVCFTLKAFRSQKAFPFVQTVLCKAFGRLREFSLSLSKWWIGIEVDSSPHLFWKYIFYYIYQDFFCETLNLNYVYKTKHRVFSFMIEWKNRSSSLYLYIRVRETSINFRRIYGSSIIFPSLTVYLDCWLEHNSNIYAVSCGFRKYSQYLGEIYSPYLSIQFTVRNKKKYRCGTCKWIHEAFFF